MAKAEAKKTFVINCQKKFRFEKLRFNTFSLFLICFFASICSQWKFSQLLLWKFTFEKRVCSKNGLIDVPLQMHSMTIQTSTEYIILLFEVKNFHNHAKCKLYTSWLFEYDWLALALCIFPLFLCAWCMSPDA